MLRLVLFFLLTFWLCLAQSAACAESEPAVEIVASHVFALKTRHGTGEMPFDVSLDWDQPQPQVTRAVVMFHGKGRDVDGYYRATLRAAKQAGGIAFETSIVVAPQFLIEEDVRVHRLPTTVLRWREGSWESGADASGPVAVSAFEVIDLIAAHLSDRRLFPNLKVIVLAGHSGGGQAIDRYAVVGRAEQVVQPSVHLHYVVANPSSYLYFSDERPHFDGDSYRLEGANGKHCKNFDHWRYGPVDVQEEYVQQSASRGWPALEDLFVQKDVTYLLGTADVDPRQKDLDVSCAGEMQGPSRFLRGQAYYGWLHNRHAASLNQRMWFVPGVAHSGSKMFHSDCGVAALFENAVCADQNPR